MASYSLTTTPQTVSTGTDYESFANTGAQRVILTWPTGRLRASTASSAQ